MLVGEKGLYFDRLPFNRWLKLFNCQIFSRLAFGTKGCSSKTRFISSVFRLLCIALWHYVREQIIYTVYSDCVLVFASHFCHEKQSALHQGLSEPEFYGDLVYKFKKNVGRADFSDQFRKIIVRYKRIGYNINIMRQSACLVFNPITVNNFASLFNCTPVGRASDSMMAPT